MKIPISKPFFSDEDFKAVLEPLQSGWVVQGPKVAAFERAFAEFTGSRFAVAMTSCTTALHAALIAADVGPGDEVILPAFTWVATANVVEMQGAKPIFIDIELDTFNIDIKQIEAAITPKTKAIIPVSLFGLSCEIDAINKLAEKHRLTVIEDDACGVGAYYKGKHAGSLAHMGCFSFHPRKAITTGEGGMIITDDDKLVEQLRSLRDHGASISDLARHQGSKSYLLPEFKMVGYNYRMTDIQGALGLSQLAKLPTILKERQRVADHYHITLQKMKFLKLPYIPKELTHGYQSFVCLYQPEAPQLENTPKLHAKRNALMQSLEEAGVATRPGTHAVHMLEFYRQKYNIKPTDYPNAYMADQLSLALPLYSQMTEAECSHVTSTLLRLEKVCAA